MSTNSFLQESTQRIEQQKRRKLMQDRRDKKARYAKATRWYIQVGKLACECFPSLLDCQSENGKEAHRELAFFEYFLKLHHNNPKIMQQLRDMFEQQRL